MDELCRGLVLTMSFKMAPALVMPLVISIADYLPSEGMVESYHHMCRWNSGLFAQEKRLAEYDYYWRVEPGVSESIALLRLWTPLPCFISCNNPI